MPLASGVASNWSIVTSPNTNAALGLNVLNGVTCVSASNCWAVGYYSNGSAYQTLIERWDGTSWAIVSSPNTASGDNGLFGVTCVSASNCWAVGGGSGFFQTLIERWDGTAWAIVTSANTSATQGNDLLGVTCVSASDCWAVGYYFNGSAYQTLIERWDGTAWAIVTSANTSPTQYNGLSGVTCVSASNCWAVGYYFGSAYQTLIERWDGTSWAIVSSPNTASGNNYLLGVTCVSASDCWAVGYYINAVSGAYQTLIERWSGTAWAIVTSADPSPTAYNVLYGVTCVSASDCWAVGYYINVVSGTTQTLIERWNGTAWAPNIDAASGPTFLSGVTCVSSSDCWAVGFYPGSADQTLIERWNGTAWAIVSSPNTNVATKDNVLSGVTCVSASDCWAVGYSIAGGARQTLIERWDGTAWAIISSPNTSATQDNFLSGVTCTSASNCWAVGYYFGSSATPSVTHGVAQTLIERWNGTAWAIVSSPNTNVAVQDNFLSGVTCTSASECWAVGFTSVSGGARQTLIERWDGTAWAIISSPNTSATQDNFLLGVTCTSASNCWAVGYSNDNTSGIAQTLIERWNGTSWAIVSSPNASGNNYLYVVTCVSASDCWAVGGNSGFRTLIERWDGTAWAIVSSPNASGPDVLNGVTCVSASDCWAVGYYITSTYQTLIERWDGTSWAIVSSPNTASGSNFLNGVTCVSASDCWAVGYYQSGVPQTLTEHYTVPPVQLNSVVSRKVHGSAGTFDIDLPLTGPRGVECRNVGALPGGATGDYQLVFSFANPLTSVGGASVTSHDPTSGTGSVSSRAMGPNANQYTVNLTGVPNVQYLTVTLTGAVDSTGATGNVSGTMGVLVGDVNSTGLVDGNDVSAVQGQARQTANSTNFRLDVNATGLIDGNDVSLVQSKTRSSLPSPP